MTAAGGCIAALNAGSSSINFAMYKPGAEGALLLRGQVERIGQAPRGRRHAPAKFSRGGVRARPSPAAAEAKHGANGLLCFRCTTKDRRQTPSLAVPKKVAETISYKFCTDLAEP
jgi:hypothetical protein